jgi:arabinose-5-phosphate isomerase
MTLAPKSISPEALAVEALELMKKKSITNLFVTDDAGSYLGVLHLHDIIKEGIY